MIGKKQNLLALPKYWKLILSLAQGVKFKSDLVRKMKIHTSEMEAPTVA
jgi:hypothetical protein